MKRLRAIASPAPPAGWNFRHDVGDQRFDTLMSQIKYSQLPYIGHRQISQATHNFI